MLGAMIGDIAGSRFEFDNHRSKEFEMFHKRCEFTDDTVMTLAVAKALLGFAGDLERFKAELVEIMHELGRKYPDRGYGGRFGWWLFEGETEPYNSFGNGSAMRVAPVAWFAETLEECEALAKASAEVTHDHPEGIKGAVATAGAAFLARTTKDMDVVKEYTAQFYEIGFTIDEIRPTASTRPVRRQSPRRCRHSLNRRILRTPSARPSPSAGTAIPSPPSRGLWRRHSTECRRS